MNVINTVVVAEETMRRSTNSCPNGLLAYWICQRPPQKMKKFTAFLETLSECEMRELSGAS